MTQNALADPHRGAQMALIEAARIDPVDVRGLLRCFWQGKLIVVATTLIAILLAGYYAFAMVQPRYAATATLHIVSSQDITGADPISANLTRETAVLRSYPLLSRVATELDLHDDPEFNRYLTPAAPWSPRGIRTQLREMLLGQVQLAPDDQAITIKTLENLKHAINAQLQEESGVLTVTVTTRLEQKSIHIANTLAAIYILDQSQSARAATEDAVAWLSDKVSEQQIELARKETAVTDLISLAAATDQAAFDDLNRQAIDTDQRLRDARTALRALTVQGQPLTANARRLQGQITALETVRANLADQLATQSAGLVQLHQLQREADAARILYNTFLGRLQDATLQGGLQKAQSRILSPAGPARYVAPRKTLIIAIAALLGAVIGTCWIFLLETMRSGFRQPAALRDATGLPVMAQMPVARLRRPVQLLDQLRTKSTRHIQDAAASLRTALLVSGTDEPPQTILCTSSIDGEDQALLSITLAQALTGLGKAVLLLEGDQRNVGITRYIHTVKPCDLHAVINRQTPLAHAISSDPRWGVDILKGYAQTPENADIFCTAAFSNFMHKLREEYDYIIINAPPVLSAPDTRMLAQHADGVVYAVRWNKTPLDVIKAGQQELETVHAPVTGLVMTQVDLRQMRQMAGETTWRAFRGANVRA